MVISKVQKRSKISRNSQNLKTPLSRCSEKHFKSVRTIPREIQTETNETKPAGNPRNTLYTYPHRIGIGWWWRAIRVQRSVHLPLRQTVGRSESTIPNVTNPGQDRLLCPWVVDYTRAYSRYVCTLVTAKGGARRNKNRGRPPSRRIEPWESPRQTAKTSRERATACCVKRVARARG